MITQPPLSNIRTLKLLHSSLLVGQLVFAAIAVYLIYSKSFYPVFQKSEIVTIVSSGVIGFACAFIIIALQIYKKKVDEIKNSDENISLKISRFRTVSIIRWAMIEAPAMLAIICYLLTGNQFLLIVIAIILFIFYYTKPSLAKVATELSMSEKEVE